MVHDFSEEKDLTNEHNSQYQYPHKNSLAEKDAAHESSAP